MVNGRLALDECFETGVERMTERHTVSKLDVKKALRFLVSA